MPAENLNKLQSIRLMPDHIADKLREAILRGRLQPGEHLKEALIAQQLGVSTGPVREAFRLLEREGLIDSLPHRGKFVHALSEREISDLYRVRDALDSLAYDMINEQGGLSEEALRQLQRDIDEVRAAAEAKDPYLTAELDLRFHDHIYELTGSKVLQDVWQALRTRLHVHFHWRLTIMPTGGPPAHEAHAATLKKLRRKDSDSAT